MTNNLEPNLLYRINSTLKSIAKIDSNLHSFLPEPGRKKRTIKEAEELMKKYAGQLKPPLYGKLIGVKDIFQVNGLPTQAGSKLPIELFAGKESLTVTKLKQAGGIILGKTVLTEFAAGEPNETVNPLDFTYSPGGSSSGSAAAIVAGLCDLSLGSQTIGSTLRPASYCGIVGFKPSYGRISTDGIIPYAPSLDTVGLFAKHVKQLIPISEVLFDNWIPTTHAASMTVLGIPAGPYLEQSSTRIQKIFAHTSKLLQQRGFRVKSVAMFSDIGQINNELWQLATYELARVHIQNGWYPKYKHLYRPKSLALIKQGLKVTDQTHQVLRQKQTALKTHIEKAMEKHGIDLWISPTASSFPPKLELRFTGDPVMNIPWTFSQLPTISIPIKDSGIMPLGLQLAAKFKEDEKLLSVSQIIQDE